MLLTHSALFSAFGSLGWLAPIHRRKKSLHKLFLSSDSTMILEFKNIFDGFLLVKSISRNDIIIYCQKLHKSSQQSFDAVYELCQVTNPLRFFSLCQSQFCRFWFQFQWIKNECEKRRKFTFSLSIFLSLSCYGFSRISITKTTFSSSSL